MSEAEIKRIEQEQKGIIEYNKLVGMRFGTGITVEDLLKKELKEPEWTIKNFLPKGLCIFIGKHKSGKSYLSLQIAINAAVGTALFKNYECKPTNTLYLGFEDSETRIHRRLIEIEAVPTKKLRIQTDYPRGVAGLEALKTLFKGYPETKLIIIDTLGRFQRGVDWNDYGQTTEYAGEIQRYAIDNDATILMVHHARKSEAEDFTENSLGSQGFVAAADTIMYLNKKRGMADAYLHATGRDFGDWEIALRQKDYGFDLIGEGKEFRMSHERHEIYEILKDEGDLIGPKDIAAMLGKNYGAVRYLLMQMVNDGEIKNPKRGFYTI